MHGVFLSWDVNMLFYPIHIFFHFKSWSPQWQSLQSGWAGGAGGKGGGAGRTTDRLEVHRNPTDPKRWGWSGGRRGTELHPWREGSPSPQEGRETHGEGGRGRGRGRVQDVRTGWLNYYCCLFCCCYEYLYFLSLLKMTFDRRMIFFHPSS